MNETNELSQLLSREERLFVLQEPKGPALARWGNLKASGVPSLQFRKFHFPHVKSPSLWKDFQESTQWSLTDTIEFKHRHFRDQAPPPLPTASFTEDRPGWDALCAKATTAILNESAHKIVPSRATSVALLPSERTALVDALPNRLFFPQMDNAYRFVVKARDSIFFGATPELLFSREGGKIMVPAVAGTRSLMGGTPESTLREELLASEKDRAEHEWVVDGICETLRGLGLKPVFAHEPSVMRAPRLLHLYTPITAIVPVSLKSEALLDALHPTPAIGGQPKEEARGFLFEYENWDRGLFSAPLLFRFPDRELCLVAIRSGLITQSQLSFFAGAGFIKGSTADGEWRETASKIRVLHEILFGGSNVRT